MYKKLAMTVEWQDRAFNKYALFVCDHNGQYFSFMLPTKDEHDVQLPVTVVTSEVDRLEIQGWINPDWFYLDEKENIGVRGSRQCEDE